MPRDFSRASRLGDQIQRELANLVRNEVRDPGLGLVTITAVDVSRDLSHAKVYVSSLQGEDGQAESLRALGRAAGFLRSKLAHLLKSRTVPELHFVHDESVERGVRLSRLIDEAVESDHANDRDSD
ncbi:MAG: 30S ribosome-binding factor RbfA [Burkholderiales bacterium]|nr:30S ribosome-binding factor RbfA [Burkholderiales bacterium]